MHAGTNNQKLSRLGEVNKLSKCRLIERDFVNNIVKYELRFNVEL